MIQAEEELIEAGQSMVITITILNSSSADLSITGGALTDGVWQGPPPVPGRTLPSGTSSYVNASSSTLGAAGGYITLVPAGGGSANLSWSWKPKSAVSAYGSLSGTSALVLSYSIANPSSYSPTITYRISDAGAVGQAEN